MNSLNLDDETLQSKGFDPRIYSVEGQCANHYIIRVMCNSNHLQIDSNLNIIVFVEFTDFTEFIDSAS